MQDELMVTTINLGENNIGTIGPEGLSEDTIQAIRSANVSPEFSKKPTNRWICVDGRLSQEEMSNSEESNEADPQIAGGIAISETAAFYMSKPQSRKLSDVVAAQTRAAIDDGIEVTVHGDDHVGKEGCGANKKLREALKFNAANIDIVAPLAWAVVEKLGIDSNLEQNDVTEAILTGKQNADSDVLWDAEPAEVADIIVNNGGKYIELVGPHKEKRIRVDAEENATFAKAKFVSAMSSEAEIEQFAASFGVYKKTVFDRALRHGTSEKEASQQVLGVVLYNLSVCKMLGSSNIDVDIVG